MTELEKEFCKLYDSIDQEEADKFFRELFHNDSQRDKRLVLNDWGNVPHSQMFRAGILFERKRYENGNRNNGSAYS